MIYAHFALFSKQPWLDCDWTVPVGYMRSESVWDGVNILIFSFGGSRWSQYFNGGNYVTKAKQNIPDVKQTFFRGIWGSVTFYGARPSVLTIGVARGAKGLWPPKFLENIVILCFERRFSKQNSVFCLKANVLPPQFVCLPKNFGLATTLVRTLRFSSVQSVSFSCSSIKSCRKYCYKWFLQMLSWILLNQALHTHLASVNGI